MCRPDDFPPHDDPTDQPGEPHRWYRPPIPAPPTVCAECGAWYGSAASYGPCSGEPPDWEPAEPTSAREASAAAWHQHQEAHR